MLVAATLHLVSCIYHTPLNLAFQDFYAKNVKNTTKQLPQTKHSIDFF